MERAYLSPSRKADPRSVYQQQGMLNHYTSQVNGLTLPLYTSSEIFTVGELMSMGLSPSRTNDVGEDDGTDLNKGASCELFLMRKRFLMHCQNHAAK